MPYKFQTEKKKLTYSNDKRVKLTLEQRQEIFDLYKSGEYSQRQLASMFGVSRSLIKCYSNPELYQHQKELYKERRKDGRYYNKEKHTKAIREHRRRKQKLYLEGKLV